MSSFKVVLELAEKIADLQQAIDIGDPCDVVRLKTEIDVLSATIQSSIARCEHKRAEELRLGLNRSIGSVGNPVRLGERFEGFKLNGVWTYRNSNPKKRGISRKWATEVNSDTNAVFDSLYVESLKDKEEVKQ